MENEKTDILPEMIIPLQDDDGNDVDCEVIAIFPVNGKQYIVFAPQGREENWLYRFIPGESKEEFKLEDIEDDEEFAAVSEVFDGLLEDAEYETALWEDEE